MLLPTLFVVPPPPPRSAVPDETSIPKPDLLIVLFSTFTPVFPKIEIPVESLLMVLRRTVPFVDPVMALLPPLLMVLLRMVTPEPVGMTPPIVLKVTLKPATVEFAAGASAPAHAGQAVVGPAMVVETVVTPRLASSPIRLTPLL